MPPQAVRSLLKSDRPSSLTRAITDLGRVPKTIHLLAFLDDETYRRRILIQLNQSEDRHAVARKICPITRDNAIIYGEYVLDPVLIRL